MKKSELKQLIKECIREEVGLDTRSPEELRKQWGTKPSVASNINLDVKQVADIRVAGVDRRDYPDFADAYISSAVYPDGKGGYRDLTEDELEWLNNEYPEIANEKAHESMQGAGDDYGQDR